MSVFINAAFAVKLWLTVSKRLLFFAVYWEARAL
jgi:hypothetical protein